MFFGLGKVSQDMAFAEIQSSLCFAAHPAFTCDRRALFIMGCRILDFDTERDAEYSELAKIHAAQNDCAAEACR